MVDQVPRDLGGPQVAQGVSAQELREDLMVLNMGPQHPSTHGVLRLLLTLDGETVVECRPIVGYLHTGIEKNAEYRTWQQGVTFVTRMDYLAPFFNELAYCLSVERLLGIQAPPRAQALRVLLCELTRIQSHLVWLATTGLELGAVSMMLYGFRERELILSIFERITGLRMNYGFIRVGGLSMDFPDDAFGRIREFLDLMPRRIEEYEDLLSQNPVWIERNRGIGVLTAEQCLRIGVTGPLLRAAGVAHDLRKASPLSGYDRYDFEVPTRTEGDCYARFEVRIEEMRQSLRICEQVLEDVPPGPVMIEDPKLRWPAQLSVGPDGIGNSDEYVRHIMEESMEALINHFKIVTQGIKVPAGEVYTAVESPRGELGYYVVSDGGVRPYRVRVRDPSFCNLPALPEMVRGRLVADVIACVASVDPVMGGVDR
ncbi:MAG TPA: NADH dehydrogenase (quinone) subunit D [Actinomycetota bacterium]|nr:NADH dehydrogenase (quinone) subunit D [Actinomycetota bacterium]